MTSSGNNQNQSGNTQDQSQENTASSPAATDAQPTQDGNATNPTQQGPQSQGR